MKQNKYICNKCDKKFDNPQRLGGHKGSHARYDGMIIAKRNIQNKCLNCKNLITTGDIRADRERKFCSRECRWEAHRTKWNEVTIFGVKKPDLVRYAERTLVCEICGNPETARTGSGKTKDNRLCRDHNHETGNFRGMLCYSCNVKLGWYEKLNKEINVYLEENNNFDKVLTKMES